MKLFNQLQDRDGSMAFPKHIKFDNGYGASVIRGEGSYGGDEGLYELAVLQRNDDGTFWLSYDTEITNTVIGSLTAKEVDDILKKIKEL